MFFANVGYTSCPDWVVDAAREEAAEGGQCAPWFEYEEEDDDDCTPGWHSINCLDGTVMYGEGCASCGDCDLQDFTAATGGLITCKRDGSYSYSYSYGRDHPATYFIGDVPGSQVTRPPKSNVASCSAQAVASHEAQPTPRIGVPSSRHSMTS